MGVRYLLTLDVLIVGMGRLELPILTEHGSEPCAYTSSATCPWRNHTRIYPLVKSGYLRCAETNLVISNMLTSPFPPKIGFNLSSAMILRLLVGFWRSCFLMYAHNCFTTCPRAIGPLPTTASSSSESSNGFINAGFAFLTIIYLLTNSTGSVPYVSFSARGLWKSQWTGYCASMKVVPIKTRIFVEGEDLPAFIYEHIPALKDGSILVVASKIVALAERRVVEIGGKEGKEAMIRQESEWMKHVFGKWWLTVRDGTVVVNAGIDESNADGMMILLPRDSFAAGSEARRRPCEAFNVKNLGVTITDSRIMPLRAGVVGVALGYAGVKG